MTSVHNSYDTRIFYKECVSLANAGYEVYLVASGDSRQEMGVNIVGVGQTPSSRIKRMTYTANAVYKKALELDCEIYHIHDPELLPYGIKLKRKGKKVIFDSHENYYEQINEKRYLSPIIRKLLSSFYISFETYCTKRFDAVIFPCTMQGKNIFDGRAKRVVFIDNHPLLDELKTAERSRKTRTNSEFIVVYCGSLTEERGITILVKAAYMANARLYLAGRIDKEYLDTLTAMEEFSCVKYLGVLSRKKMMSLYNRSNVGAATLQGVGQYLKTDNLPTKVLEYMGMELPVIVSEYPFSKAVIDKYKCGICVRPDNVKQIARAIETLRDNPYLAEQMGKNGRKAVEEEFNWGSQEKKLLELYFRI